MVKFSESTFAVLEDAAEIKIGLGANEIIRGHGHCVGSMHARGGKSPQQEPERKKCWFGIHDLSSSSDWCPLSSPFPSAEPSACPQSASVCGRGLERVVDA